MKLNVVEEESKSMTIEFEEVDRGIPELIKDKLMANKDIDFVGVVKEHPEIGKPRLVVKASKNPKPLVIKALEEVQKEIKELSSDFGKK